jgi:tRNA(Ile)-lysidine synthase
MLGGGERVIAAVSGGPDSVCLLLVLIELQKRAGFEVAGVAHFNHQLRGEESDGDEASVAALSAKLGLKFFRAEGSLTTGNLEQEARRARRNFFARLLEQGRAEKIALGHTRDDQAETVLLRFLRGSGPSGLAGILPVTREGLVRPLLEVSRKQVEAYLQAAGVEWREDRTNSDTRFTRNRIRHKLLPHLASNFNPAISETLSHLAQIAYQEELWWAGEVQALADRHLLQIAGRVEFRADVLEQLPPALARRLVRRAIELAKGDLRRVEFPHVEKVRELARSGTGTGRARLPGLFVQRSYDWVRLSAHFPEPVERIEAALPGSYRLAGSDACISLEVIEKNGSDVDQNASGPSSTLKWEVCLNFVTGPLELRGFETGDCYWPLGRNRAYRVKELLAGLRVPSWRRASWPVLLSRTPAGETRIVWAREFGVAKELAAPEGFLGRVLQIRESLGSASAPLRGGASGNGKVEAPSLSRENS